MRAGAGGIMGSDVVATANPDGYVVPIDSTTFTIAPAKTPSAVVRKFYQEVVKAKDNADVKSRLSATGTPPMTSPPEKFQVVFRAEVQKWGSSRSRGRGLNRTERPDSLSHGDLRPPARTRSSSDRILLNFCRKQRMMPAVLRCTIYGPRVPTRRYEHR